MIISFDECGYISVNGLIFEDPVQVKNYLINEEFSTSARETLTGEVRSYDVEIVNGHALFVQPTSPFGNVVALEDLLKNV